MQVKRELLKEDVKDYMSDIHQRMIMKENFVVNPIMQTFDLLDMQEASLTCIRINKNQTNKCRRNQTTN